MSWDSVHVTIGIGLIYLYVPTRVCKRVAQWYASLTRY